MKTSQNPRMEQDLFTNLPSEMKKEILSRLPIRSALRCKLVHKSWRSLIESPEFIKSSFKSSVVAVFQKKSSEPPYKVYEVDEDAKIPNKEVLSFSFPPKNNNQVFCFSFREAIHSSANGLLLLFVYYNVQYCDLMICNPITREYIRIPSPWVFCQYKLPDSYGFGVSKLSGLYKLVRIFKQGRFGRLVCQVYTIGVSLFWSCPRRIAMASSLVLGRGTMGISLNGNLHWLAYDLKGFLRIYCFDLESECFTTLSPPPHLEGWDEKLWSLSALRDCLGLCDNSSKNEIVIWMMKDYGDEKSWSKQYVIPKRDSLCSWNGVVCVIKVLKEGGVLIKEEGESRILYFSNNNNNKTTSSGIQETHLTATNAVCYTPTLLSLRSLFPKRNVTSF